MKPYCKELDKFSALSKKIGAVPASFKLNCRLYDYSSEFGTKYLPSPSIDKFFFNIANVIYDFGLINLIGIMLVVVILRTGK